MNTGFPQPIENIPMILNLFSQSTGDIYIFYDFSEELVYFSENILTSNIAYAFNKTTCTIQEWRQHVDPRDIHRLIKATADLTSRKNDSYNLNYRVNNSQNQKNWINSRGHAYYGEKGQLSFALGRLSICAVTDYTQTFRNQSLKEEITNILKCLQEGFLLLIGVDNLKALNLKNGRDFGDAVLNDVAQVMAVKPITLILFTG